MNLIDAYRYLAALEQHRHFGRAAAACHITQPALSNALRSLEAQLGTAIVRRGRLYEGLTPEGERVLATAHRVLHEQELLLQELASSAAAPRGRLVIGTVPTALPIAARFAARLIGLHPGIVPQVLSLASQDIETGLDRLVLDLGLGYTDRLATLRGSPLQPWPQYVEHYHLLQRVDGPGAPVPGGLRFGEPVTWAEAATKPLALLCPDMHNRVILDEVFRGLGLDVKPVLETNSVLALGVAVQAGAVAAVLPGALVGTLGGAQPGMQQGMQAGMQAGQGALLARPLVAPALRTPIGFMTARAVQGSRTLNAALALAQDAAWLAEAAAHSGPLNAREG